MAQPVRVLQVVTQMNRAGMENRLMDIYRHINREKVQFDFYTCRRTPGIFDEEIISLGGRIFYNDSLSMKNIASIPNQFSTFLRKHYEYGIVHCHLNQWCGLVLAGAKKANVPVRIAHSRTSLEKSSLKNSVKNLIKLPVNYTATHRFAVSEKAGQWLFGRKAVSSGSVQIWPNAIDCEKFRFNPVVRDQVRKELCIENMFTLIHVGNLRPEKNHIFLLDVFLEVKSELPNSQLMLIGADYLNGAIQHEAKKLGIYEDILFLGSRSDIHKLLQAGDVFVFPSFYEGFPGAVLEAQAAGLPCLLSDIITHEVKVLKSTIYLSLKEPPLRWAQAAISTMSGDRYTAYKKIIVARYDIYTVSKSYAEFYLNVRNYS